MTSIDTFCTQYGVERKQTNSLKWDELQNRFGASELLPLWVADMDFKIPKSVQKAMAERIEHGVFGYSTVPDSYYTAFFNWMSSRFGVNLERDWLRFSTGVVNSIYWLVNAFTNPGDAVIILTPVYYPFHNAIKDNKRKLVSSELAYRDGKYTIDFAAFEEQIIKNDVKLFIHCSPHNPVGRVWTGQELIQLYDICVKHDVLIVSDEVHQDFVRKDLIFISSLTLKDYFSHLVILNSASKTFNLASLLHSHVIIPDSRNRAIYDDYTKTIHQAEISVMGIIATEACYLEGEEWLADLSEVIEYNYRLLKETFAQKAPQILVSEKEGTYLVWIDLSQYIDPSEIKPFIQDKCRLAVDYGEWFGEQSKGFIRLNLATRPECIQYVTEQIIQNVERAS